MLVLEYLEFTQLSNPMEVPFDFASVLEYLEFTQLSNSPDTEGILGHVLEYLEFTQLSNIDGHLSVQQPSFRVPGIYTALKQYFPSLSPPSRF